MDAIVLREAYRALVTAASSISSTTPVTDDERHDIDWRLVHIALSDQLLADATRRVTAGLPAVVDNHSTVDADRIARSIASSTRAQRIETLGRHAAELLDLIETHPDGVETAEVELRIHDRDGHRVAEERVTWAELIAMRARHHVPGHAAWFAEIAARE